MNPCVLVVDDDFANRMLPGLILRGMGYAVHECANGAEALTVLAREAITHVLMDISMPEVSGIDICRNLRNDHRQKHLKIFAYTAHAMAEQAREIQNAGFDGVLVKPIREADLQAIFR